MTARCSYSKDPNICRHPLLKSASTISRDARTRRNESLRVKERYCKIKRRRRRRRRRSRRRREERGKRRAVISERYDEGLLSL
ncbi:hypothetical protein HZH68_009053 [Vespula germanica]|uniref:Uncharacterized protein n=1 Tax=Vespula germanica TaxID=30212 RepID=A0A834K5T8_VESGE|nr:hypothetical protein HZH68_009053 [Vespula germanica]